MDVQEQDYGEVAGRPVTRYVLSNDHGTSIAILSYACLWQSFGVLEDGVRRELVVGFDRLEDYVATPYAVGKVVGRVAGRIAEARFVALRPVRRRGSFPREPVHFRRPGPAAGRGWTPKTWLRTLKARRGCCISRAASRVVRHGKH